MTDFRFSLRTLLFFIVWAALCMGVLSAGLRSSFALEIVFGTLLLLGGVMGYFAIPNIRGVWLGSLIPTSAFGFGILLDVVSRWWAS